MKDICDILLDPSGSLNSGGYNFLMDEKKGDKKSETKEKVATACREIRNLRPEKDLKNIIIPAFHTVWDNYIKN